MCVLKSARLCFLQQHMIGWVIYGGLAEKIDPFESLCRGIISQQVFGAVAKAIKWWFVELFSSHNDDDRRQREGDEPHVRRHTCSTGLELFLGVR
ncbi:hypothetical protein DL763_008563 [Monosporascus cannonballus]|nr:hypothetical protein DL763_008563 [Monosporascus cannonballus]